MFVIRQKDGVIYAKYESKGKIFDDCAEVTAEEFEQIIPPCKKVGDEYVMCEPPTVQGVETPYVAPDPKKQREEAYKNMLYREDGTPLILWESESITVDQSNEKWWAYTAEGSAEADELQGLITEAKEYIRELFPDEEQ